MFYFVVFVIKAYGGLVGYDKFARIDKKRENIFQLKDEKGYDVGLKSYVEDRLLIVKKSNFLVLNISINLSNFPAIITLKMDNKSSGTH